MAIQRIGITGGSGTIGHEIIKQLTNTEYKSVNLDKYKPTDVVADEFVQVDLLDAGQVYGALARWDVDAVIHLGTITDPNNNPGYVTFESNVMSTYNIMETSEELGLEAVTLASSINAHGWSFQEVPPRIDYLPIDEEHPVSPRDPYGLGKHVLEVTADGFARRQGLPNKIASLRISGALDDDALDRIAARDLTLDDLREQYEPGDNPTFRYLHIGDVAQLAIKATIRDFNGHEIFWAVAPDSTVDVPTEKLIDTFYQEIEIRKPLTGNDGFFDISKSQDMLGWEPQHSWRNHGDGI